MGDDTVNSEDDGGAVATVTAPGTAGGRPACRLTVCEQVYHQKDDHEGTAVPTAFGRWLVSDEQAVNRRLTVGPAWGELNAYWLAGQPVGMLVLYNNEPPPADAIPLPVDALETLQAAVVEVSFNPDDPQPDVIVRPGESCRFEPARVGRIRVRAGNGRGVKATLLLIPG